MQALLASEATAAEAAARAEAASVSAPALRWRRCRPGQCALLTAGRARSRVGACSAAANACLPPAPCLLHSHPPMSPSCPMPAPPTQQATLARFRDLCEEHLREEEQELLPLLRKHFTPKEFKPVVDKVRRRDCWPCAYNTRMVYPVVDDVWLAYSRCTFSFLSPCRPHADLLKHALGRRATVAQRPWPCMRGLPAGVVRS